MDGLLKCAVLLPSTAQQCWGAPQRKFLRIQAAANVLPQNRHRNGGAVARPWRQHRHRRGQPVVAQVVQEDLADAPALRHVVEIFPRTIVSHLRANDVRKILGYGPLNGALTCSQRGHHMEALAPGGLAEGFKAGRFEPIADFDRGGDDRVEIHIRRGVQIEHQPTGDFRIARRAVPGMDFQGGNLRGRDQGLDPIDLHVGCLVASDFHGCQKIRHSGRRMTLKELLGAHSVRHPDERAGSALEVRQHPITDILVVSGEVGFGHGSTVARVRPERLVGF